MESKVQRTLEESIERILTPKTNIDIIRDITEYKKREKKPYSMVFVGINGVGKSTSLAKVVYYLKSHGLKVLMVACDTFRSGAVEQLQTHSDFLGVPLFSKGYHKDPSAVATAGMQHAITNDYDVIVIDTAGRMQNKEPLMQPS